jgi:hypothetical protein
MRNCLVRKFGSFIGLLAILMTTLAPAVSQALASSARANAMLSVHCSVITESQTRVVDHQPSHHSTSGHQDACGYCNFAAHSPAAAPSVGALPVHLSAATLAVTALAYSAAPHTPVLAAQPRAPPFFA